MSENQNPKEKKTLDPGEVQANQIFDEMRQYLEVKDIPPTIDDKESKTWAFLTLTYPRTYADAKNGMPSRRLLLRLEGLELDTINQLVKDAYTNSRSVRIGMVQYTEHYDDSKKPFFKALSLTTEPKGYDTLEGALEGMNDTSGITCQDDIYAYHDAIGEAPLSLAFSVDEAFEDTSQIDGYPNPGETFLDIIQNRVEELYSYPVQK